MMYMGVKKEGKKQTGKYMYSNMLKLRRFIQINTLQCTIE
jgi:hypothetical protein